MSAGLLDVPRDLLERLARPGPRYTSYPTAAVFDGSVGPAEYAAALARHGASGAPLSLYVHLPFCRTLCFYCACNVIITRRPGAAEDYLDLLEREADLVAGALGRRMPVTQLHLGGGTPTYLTSAELRRLHGLLSVRFDLSAAEELAVEVDPRSTTIEQLETLARLGWNRASFGVQDFDPAVQRAIHRVQSVEQTRALVEAARRLGYRGINVDLIYGLPLQRAETFARTLDAVLALRPDRIALYSYAHVPWMRPAQARFERKGLSLPRADEKLALLQQAVRALVGAGYQHLGMDHFALPDDELSLALDRGALHRNFQGYTVRRADALVALGMSAISEVGDVFAQNEKDLPAYEAALDAGRLPTSRGRTLTTDDRARRQVILALMTGGTVPAALLAPFPAERAALDDLARDGLVRWHPSGDLGVTALGRAFVRNVAMVFDAYLGGAPDKRYSQTV
ncbi:MAG: oxygen-independent coproporphyrinogen III oxidase [Planctomycetes bacterium]|nr:oxygen-independent coproporphyrinogen III oxidase [Planctomycetota bacterium]